MHFFEKKFLISFVVFLFNPMLRAELPESQAPSSVIQGEVVKLRGLNFDLIASRRVRLAVGSRAPRQLNVGSVVNASLSDEISAEQRGLVYNYSMQAYGLTTGEITFAAQPNFDVRNLVWAPTAAPHSIGSTGMFVVNVGSGSEFVRVLRMLKDSSSVKWVEPSVEYVNNIFDNRK